MHTVYKCNKENRKQEEFLITVKIPSTPGLAVAETDVN